MNTITPTISKKARKEEIKSLIGQIKAAKSKKELRKICNKLDKREDDTVEILSEHFTFNVPWPYNTKNKLITNELDKNRWPS